MKKRGVNVFTHNGGVAAGLQDEIDFGLYTCHNKIIKDHLERKMHRGELRKATIVKFVYAISSSTFSEGGADIVVGLVHHRQWQKNELSIPDIIGRFPENQSSKEMVHRASLYESLAVATASRATEILLFFPYNPFAPALQTMSVLRKQHVAMRCFEFPLQGKYTPFSTLYALEIKRLSKYAPPRDTAEFIRVRSLAIRVSDSPSLEERGMTQDETFLYRNALIWDIAPGIIREARSKMKEAGVAPHGDHLLTIYSSLDKPAGESWDYGISDNMLLQFASQGPSLGSLGWTRQDFFNKVHNL